MIGMSILFLGKDFSRLWLGMAEIDIFGIIFIADDDDDEALCFQLKPVASNLLVPALAKTARLCCWKTTQLAGSLSMDAIVQSLKAELIWGVGFLDKNSERVAARGFRMEHLYSSNLITTKKISNLIRSQFL